jgi:hypothetical protein
MPKVTVQGGLHVEIPNREEIRTDVASVMDERQRVAARGFKPVRYAQPGNGTLTQFFGNFGPEQGYVWNLKLLSVQLASSGTVLAYLASSAPSTGATPARLIANFGNVAGLGLVEKWSSSQIIMQPGEGIYLVALGSGANISEVFLAAAEMPAEMVFKVYD